MAASTCSQAPCRSADEAIAGTGSTAIDEVDPTVAAIEARPQAGRHIRR